MTDDRDWIEEIENKLNLASKEGICSIPYVITAKANLYGIYLKRSLDGTKYLFGEQEQRVIMSTIARLFLREFICNPRRGDRSGGKT